MTTLWLCMNCTVCIRIPSLQVGLSYSLSTRILLINTSFLVKTVLEEDDTNSNDNVTNKPEIFDESDEDDDYFSSTTARDAAVTRRILRNPVVTTRYRTEDEFETTTPLSGRRTTFHGDFESVDGHKVSSTSKFNRI